MARRLGRMAPSLEAQVVDSVARDVSVPWTSRAPTIGDVDTSRRRGAGSPTLSMRCQAAAPARRIHARANPMKTPCARSRADGRFLRHVSRERRRRRRGIEASDRRPVRSKPGPVSVPRQPYAFHALRNISTAFPSRNARSSGPRAQRARPSEEVLRPRRRSRDSDRTRLGRTRIRIDVHLRTRVRFNVDWRSAGATVDRNPTGCRLSDPGSHAPPKQTLPCEKCRIACRPLPRGAHFSFPRGPFRPRFAPKSCSRTIPIRYPRRGPGKTRTYRHDTQSPPAAQHERMVPHRPARFDLHAPRCSRRPAGSIDRHPSRKRCRCARSADDCTRPGWHARG